jgi:hypothetical protein
MSMQSKTDSYGAYGTYGVTDPVTKNLPRDDCYSKHRVA